MDKEKIIELLQEMAGGSERKTVRITRERKEALNLALFIIGDYDKKQASWEDAAAILEEAEKVRERSARNVQTAVKLLGEVEANNRRCEGILDDARTTSEETKEYLEKAGQRLVVQLILLAVQIGALVMMVALK